MRRETAIRLSVTIDRDLAQWLDGFAHDERTTKSIIIESLVGYMREDLTGEAFEHEDITGGCKNETH